jgi:tripartite-type tricarboxylate transporter receptor subunit TctC
MKIPRRSLLRLAGGAVALPAVTRLARAQSYPSRSVLILVGYAAGGPTDICARLIAEALSKTLGQQFVVENRDGAGSNIATEAAIHADPDGYSLLLVTTSNAINATLYSNLNYNFLRDVAPVAGIMQAPSVLEVNPSFPVQSIAEFIAYAKANPGKINLGTAGNGSPPHMYAELFMAMTGIKLNVVGYRGGGPALVDLLSGQTQAMIEGIPSSIGYIKGGKLRPLGVTSAQRSAALPDVPPIGDTVPGYDAAGWFGLAAPKATPAPVIAALSNAVAAALKDEGMQAKMAKLGAAPMPMGPAEFGKYIGDDTEKWAKVIGAAGLKVD